MSDDQVLEQLRCGPRSALELANLLRVPVAEIAPAVQRLHREGSIKRGRYPKTEWSVTREWVRESRRPAGLPVRAS